MPDIYNLYKEFDKDGIILSFKGDITEEMLSSIYEVMERKQEINLEQKRRTKMFYHILVECLQNIFHHSETTAKESAVFMIGRDEDGNYRIMTGNNMLNSNIEGLKAKIEKINVMNADELHAYYLDKLNSTELSEKGGAGLGIIEMARKSGNKLEYGFHKVSDQYSFFTLGVTLK